MKFSKTKVAAFAAGIAALSAGQALAVPIIGDIDLGGAVHYDTDFLGTGTNVSSFIAVCSGRTGSFTPFISPFVGSVPINGYTLTSGANQLLWSAGGFSFTLTTVSVTFQNDFVVFIQGSGFLTGPAGFDQTPALWNMTSNKSDGAGSATFNFSSSTAAGAPVPDGGSTAAFLGLALAGMGGLRGKFSARKVVGSSSRALV